MNAGKWTVISTLTAVAALIVPIVLYSLGRQTKALSVVTVSAASVADLSKPALSALRLTYHDEQVSKVSTATFEVSNSGTEIIHRTDFDRPLAITFAGRAPLLTTTIDERVPSSIHPEIRSDSEAVTVAPLLLNPGDRFRVSVVLRGAFVEPSVDGRIAGVTAITRAALDEEAPVRLALIQLGLGVGATFAYFYLAVLANPFRGRGIAFIRNRDAILVALLLAVLGARSLLGGIRQLGVGKEREGWILLSTVTLLAVGSLVGIRPLRRFDEKVRMSAPLSGGDD